MFVCLFFYLGKLTFLGMSNPQGQSVQTFILTTLSKAVDIHDLILPGVTLSSVILGPSHARMPIENFDIMQYLIGFHQHCKGLNFKVKVIDYSTLWVSHYKDELLRHLRIVWCKSWLGPDFLCGHCINPSLLSHPQRKSKITASRKLMLKVRISAGSRRCPEGGRGMQDKFWEVRIMKRKASRERSVTRQREPGDCLEPGGQLRRVLSHCKKATDSARWELGPGSFSLEPRTQINKVCSQ